MLLDPLVDSVVLAAAHGEDHVEALVVGERGVLFVASVTLPREPIFMCNINMFNVIIIVY